MHRQDTGANSCKKIRELQEFLYVWRSVCLSCHPHSMKTLCTHRICVVTANVCTASRRTQLKGGFLCCRKKKEYLAAEKDPNILTHAHVYLCICYSNSSSSQCKLSAVGRSVFECMKIMHTTFVVKYSLP